MFEFHAWLILRDSTEESDRNVLSVAVAELRTWLAARVVYLTATWELRELNGTFFLNLTGLANRRTGRPEADDLDELLRWVATRLPGSYGLLYEQSDDMPVPPGPGAFRVRVLRRGGVSAHLDPFLSPMQPNVED